MIKQIKQSCQPKYRASSLSYMILQIYNQRIVCPYNARLLLNLQHILSAYCNIYSFLWGKINWGKAKKNIHEYIQK